MRAAFIVGLKVLVGGGLLAVVISHISPGEAFAAAAGLDPATFAAAVALYFLAHAAGAARFQLLLPALSFPRAYRFTMIGVLYGFALPGQIAGDAVKALRMARAQGKGDAVAAVAAVAVDKIISIFALLVLMALAIGLESRVFGQTVVMMLALGTVAMVAALAGVLLLPLPDWLGRTGVSVARWRELSMTPSRLSFALALGMLFQALCVAICAILGEKLNVHLSLPGWILVMGFSALVLIVPITVAGIGVREATLVGATAYLGGNEAGALALSFVLFLITLIGAAAGLALDLAGRDRA
jgi:uncharacterized membrane protein YbhN (UPF0104 family)